MQKYSSDVCFVTSDELKNLAASVGVARLLFISQKIAESCVEEEARINARQDVSLKKTRSATGRTTTTYNTTNNTSTSLSPIEITREANRLVPGADAVAQDTLLLANVVQFLLSKLAAMCCHPSLTSSQHNTSQSFSNTSSRSGGGNGDRHRGTLKSIVNELVVALKRVVMRDKHYKLVQLHEYYIAVLAGTKKFRLVRSHSQCMSC